MEDKFFEEIEKLDFENDPESQRLYINNWVENTTHGEITDLLIPGSITKNTKLAIVNAAYFKGTYQSKFKPEETKKEIFYVSNERQEFVDMMHVEGTFNHGDRQREARLPHPGAALHRPGRSVPRFDVRVPTPHRIQRTDKLLARLTSSPNILCGAITRALFPRPVDMKTVLGRGMGKLFENSANFSGFSKKVQVGEMLVKFKITVNEEGATVASATVEFNFRSSRPDDPAMFHCNHPFIFVI
ncbi:antithrombin-III [Culex quinquefasciatus]|uniref:Antithrombin-III n=1 Tax=Culex quinquefasciatus TaxID=7176 RepID=B0X0T0_CULQU|nr:antithrombin-III [Culex quinquefasciatus]|eukprot:XP_001863252.1 antithrombin-III [Culex quinquefasciatus]